MPTVLRKNGFNFMIYINDHTPAHVHIMKAGVEVIINLGDDHIAPTLRDNRGMSRQEVMNALKITFEVQATLLERWREIHG